MTIYIAPEEAYKRGYQTGLANGLSIADNPDAQRGVAQALAPDLLKQIDESYERGYEAGKAHIEQGRWVKKACSFFSTGRFTQFECSVCGECNDYDSYNYCPNCGARMDLKGENDGRPD